MAVTNYKIPLEILKDFFSILSISLSNLRLVLIYEYNFQSTYKKVNRDVSIHFLKLIVTRVIFHEY